MAGFMDRVADFSEKSRINSQIKNFEKQKNDLFTNAGALVYNLCASGKLQIPECEAMFTEIADLDRRIAEEKDKIKQLEEARAQQMNPVIPGGIPCSCGRVNVPGSRFCAGCGQPVYAAPAPVYTEPAKTEPEYPSTEYAPDAYESDAGQCPACGFANKPEALFCANCGQTIIGGAPESEPVAPLRTPGQCMVCGSINKPEAVFCAECGAQLN